MYLVNYLPTICRMRPHKFAMDKRINSFLKTCEIQNFFFGVFLYLKFEILMWIFLSVGVSSEILTAISVGFWIRCLVENIRGLREFYKCCCSIIYSSMDFRLWLTYIGDDSLGSWLSFFLLYGISSFNFYIVNYLWVCNSKVSDP